MAAGSGGKGGSRLHSMSRVGSLLIAVVHLLSGQIVWRSPGYSLPVEAVDYLGEPTTASFRFRFLLGRKFRELFAIQRDGVCGICFLVMAVLVRLLARMRCAVIIRPQGKDGRLARLSLPLGDMPPYSLSSVFRTVAGEQIITYRPGAVIYPSPGAPRHCLPCSRISVGGRPMCCPSSIPWLVESY